jgi:hypothetical protein
MMTIVRSGCVILVLAGLMFACSLNAQYVFDSRKHDDMEAVLTVEVAKETAERGRGEATLTLTITGPATLDVEAPRVGDAAAAWKEERPPETREVQGERAIWKQVMRLKQIKPGPEPLADLSVRFRRGPDDEWKEEKWTDILRHVRFPQPQMLHEEGPSWLRRWGFVLILSVTGLLVLLAWLGRRRGVRREAPSPPDEWALREIERIEKTLMPPQGQVEMYHTQMSYVVRRYLADRFGLHALQQTTAEFLEAVRPVPQVTTDHQKLLAELFERCDLAKFARASTAPEECRRTAEMARGLVQLTSKD